jgi:hypothetical protein
MNQRSIFGISAMMILGLALVPNSAVAQKTLKAQLVGAWTLVSCDNTAKNGERLPYCANPSGILILDASGRYANVIAKRDRPKSITSANRSEASAEEWKAMAQGLVANFGTWSVNDADKTITFHREGALFPEVEGTDQNNFVSLSGDELKLVTPNPFFNGRNEALFRRAE